VSLTRMARTSAKNSAVSAAPASARGDRGGAAAADRAEGEDQHGTEEGPGEGEPDVPGRGADAEQVDGEDDAERGAGGEAQQAGVAQRVAGVALGERAGDAEGQADHEAERGAGKPQLTDDHRLLGGDARVGQGLPDGPQADAAGADRDAEGGGDHHQDEQQEQAQQPAPAPCQQAASPRRSSARWVACCARTLSPQDGRRSTRTRAAPGQAARWPRDRSASP
jgi:hypothetical protein